MKLEAQDLNSSISQRYGDKRATILDVGIFDMDFNPTDELISNGTYYVQVSVKFNEDLPTFSLGCSLSSLDGIQQLTWINTQDGVQFNSIKKDAIKIVTIKVNIPIKEDIYNLSVGVEYPVAPNQQHQYLDVIMKLKPIKVNFESPSKGFSAMFYTKGTYTVNESLS